MKALKDDKHEPVAGEAESYREAHLAQLMQNGLTPRAAEAAIAIEDVMARIRRGMARREMARGAIADLGLDLDVPHLEVVQALGTRRAAGGEEVTVGTIAERMGIDPSRASRIVADVVDRGLALRVASQSDARRICLKLTDLGRAVRAAIQEYKALIFAEALRDWPEEELVLFARLFARFGDWVGDSRAHSAETAKRFAPLAERLKRQPKR